MLEKERNQEEAMYNYIIAIIDLIYNKYRKQNLGKYVSSLLFLAYEEEIIDEQFFSKYALGNTKYIPNKPNVFLNKEHEDKFFMDSNEFINWLRYKKEG